MPSRSQLSPALLTSVALGWRLHLGQARLLVGTPLRASENTAIFGPGSFVVLMQERQRAAPVYIFRTLESVSAGATVVPGVAPAVHLLADTSSRRAASRVRNALIRLGREGRDPSAMSDVFWSDMAVVANGRLRGVFPRLPSLISRDDRRRVAHG
jgi:hypothetical protein